MSPEVREHFLLCLEAVRFQMRFWRPAPVLEPDDPRYDDEIRALRDWLEDGHRQALSAGLRAVADSVSQMIELLNDTSNRAPMLNHVRTLLKSLQAVEAHAPLDSLRREVLGPTLVTEGAVTKGRLGAIGRKARADERNEKIFDLACKLRREDPTLSNKALVRAIFDQLSIEVSAKTIENLLSSPESKKRVPSRFSSA